MSRGGDRSEDRRGRADSVCEVAALVAGFLPLRPPRIAAFAGLAQSKLDGPLESDAGVEAQVHDVRQAPGLPASGARRGLSLAARVWIAVAAAALLWAVIAGVLALIS